MLQLPQRARVTWVADEEGALLDDDADRLAGVLRARVLEYRLAVSVQLKHQSTRTSISLTKRTMFHAK